MNLPPGFLLVIMRLWPYTEQLFASITDGRDHYQQAEVTSEWAQPNVRTLALRPHELLGLSAFSDILHCVQCSRTGKRLPEKVDESVGGRACLDSYGDVGFTALGSLAQGDRLGVDFALEAHESLLKSHGFLLPDSRLLGHWTFPAGAHFEGLVIIDYLANGKEKVGAVPASMFVASALAVACDVYQKHSLLGLAGKDNEAKIRFKAAGAEVVSSELAVGRGLTTVGALLVKRLGSSVLRLRAVRLSSTTSRLISRLEGGWASTLKLRGCPRSIIDGMLALAADAETAEKNFRVSQPAKFHEKRVLLAIFAPITCTGIAVIYCPYVFASDVSLGLGAVVCTSVSQKVLEALFLGSDRTDMYSKLVCSPGQLPSVDGEEHVDDLRLAAGVQGDSLEKPLLLHYDFVEFFGGSGRVSAEAQKCGLVVAPLLEFGSSAHFNTESSRSLERPFHMIETGLFVLSLSEPLCTTFSVVACPAWRFYWIPLGFDPTRPRTKQGNCLALRSLARLRHGRRYRRPCGNEQPRPAMIAWLFQWQRLLDLGSAKAVIASCQYYSPPREEIRLSTYTFDSKLLEVCCFGVLKRLKIGGKHTRPSAAYTHDLAGHFAVHFAAALRLQRLPFDEEILDDHGNFVANDVFAPRQFSCVVDLAGRNRIHFHVVEARGALRVVELAARRFESCRVTALLDPRVAKGALPKGRCTTCGLQRVCKVAAALQVAADVHKGWDFAPPRLNGADDPTWSELVRRATSGGFSDQFSLDELRNLHFRGRKSCLDGSGWRGKFPNGLAAVLSQRVNDASIVISQISELYAPWSFGLPFFYHSFGLTPLTAFYVLPWISWILPLTVWTSLALASWIFGISLEFLCLAGLQRVWISGQRRGLVCVLSLSFAAPGRWIWAGQASASAMEPSSAADLLCAEYRDPSGFIPTGVARNTTLNAWEKLLTIFGSWHFFYEVVFSPPLFSTKPPDPEEIRKWLVQYGQQMSLAVKACEKHAETTDAVATTRPTSGMQSPVAWYLAFACLAEGPFQLFPALSLYVIGKTIIATQVSFVMPGDSALGTAFALLRIRFPRKSGRLAKHQAACIESPDVLQLFEATYADFPADKKLWLVSAATLRIRFIALVKEFGLPTTRTGGLRLLDLGSLRPGGASFLLLASEIFIPCAQKRIRDRIALLAGGFKGGLQVAKEFLQYWLATWFVAHRFHSPRRRGAWGARDLWNWLQQQQPNDWPCCRRNPYEAVKRERLMLIYIYI